MPHLASPSSPVPVTQAAELDAQPPVKVGHVPQSLLPANTAHAGDVPMPVEPAREPLEPMAVPPESPEETFELPTLSPEALLFMTSAHYKESDARVGRAFTLSEDDLSFLHEMDQMVLGGMIGVDGYIRAMRGEFPEWDEATRQKLIGQLVAERFVPWGDRLKPSAKAAAEEEGVSLPHTPYYAVYDGALTYRQAAEEIAKMVGVPFTPNMILRLADLVKSRSKGIRVAAQAEAQLLRPLDQGGLGLAPEQARATVIAMGDLLKRVDLEEGETEASVEPPPAQAPIEEVVPVFVPDASTPDITFVPDVEEDAKEVAAIAKVMPRAASRAHVVAQAVAAVMGTLTGTPEDPYLLRRLENIVSTRLRDVRSRNEVLSTLSRGEKVGGLGLGRAEAERLTQEIENGYAEWHEKIAAEEALAREQYTRAQATKSEEQKKQEAAEHAAWFAERQRQQQALKRPPVRTSAPVAPGQHPLDAREKAREEQAFGELVNAPTKSMGVEDFLTSLSGGPAPAVMQKPVPKKAPPVPPPVPKKAQAPAVRISAESAQAAGTTPVRPRMDDVQEVRSGLVGPQQELERLTLGAFRRLGKTPEAAAAHVRDLVGLLQEQSFGKRVEGIQAWQGSPLQRQYVELVAEAFSSGTPMKDLLAKKRTAGEDVPTDEELTAIVGLNGDLRL